MRALKLLQKLYNLRHHFSSADPPKRFRSSKLEPFTMVQSQEANQHSVII